MFIASGIKKRPKRTTISYIELSNPSIWMQAGSEYVTINGGDGQVDTWTCSISGTTLVRQDAAGPVFSASEPTIGNRPGLLFNNSMLGAAISPTISLSPNNYTILSVFRGLTIVANSAIAFFWNSPSPDYIRQDFVRDTGDGMRSLRRDSSNVFAVANGSLSTTNHAWMMSSENDGNITHQDSVGATSTSSANVESINISSLYVGGIPTFTRTHSWISHVILWERNLNTNERAEVLTWAEAEIS